MGHLARTPKGATSLLILFFLLCGRCLAQPDYRIREDSSIEIHLGKSGLFSFLGDEHFILAPIERGRIQYDPQAVERSSVLLDVRTSRIQVQDPKRKEKDRAEIQNKMEGAQVLNVAQFPWIHFESSKIQAISKKEFLVEGMLTLRDVTAPVTVRVLLKSLDPVFQATGRARFKQSRFGMVPVTAGAGTVRVKDEVELTFTVNAVPENSP